MEQMNNDALRNGEHEENKVDEVYEKPELRRHGKITLITGGY